MFPSPTEKNIKKISNDKIVKAYMKMRQMCGNMYRCSKISVYGTAYHTNQYITLPGSTNSSMKFGKIVDLLCYKNNYAYFKYETLTSEYCVKSDLYFVKGQQKYEIVPQHHLPCYRLGLHSRLKDLFIVTKLHHLRL